MGRYLEIAQSVRDIRSYINSLKSKPGIEIMQDTARSEPAAKEPEERRLMAASWKPKQRGGLTIWARPTNGFFYSEEVALNLLDQDNARQT
jgi:hypothetical protein